MDLGDLKRKVALCTKHKLINSLYDKELLEILSDQEHKRWASWQKYVHEKCIKNEDGSLTIPKESVLWWEEEIKTSYNNLNEKQKESDRNEVRPVIDLICKYLKNKFF